MEERSKKKIQSIALTFLKLRFFLPSFFVRYIGLYIYLSRVCGDDPTEERPVFRQK